MFNNSCIKFSLLVLLSCLLHSLTESETSYTWRLDLSGEGKIVADMGVNVPPRPGDDTQVMTFMCEESVCVCVCGGVKFLVKSV